MKEDTLKTRFEEKFCRNLHTEHGIHQIGIVNPWKNNILKFIEEEIIRDRNERSTDK